MNKLNGHLYAFLAFSIWGLAPLYWVNLKEFDVTYLTFHRLLWGGVILWIIALTNKEYFSFKTLLRFPLSAFLIVSNWAVFVYAVSTGHVVEASLGYFINPLINVFLGRFFFKEIISKVQIFALILGGIGTITLFQDPLSDPWICLVLPLTFGFYGVLHKKNSSSSMLSLRYEIIWGILFVFIGLLLFDNRPISDFLKLEAGQFLWLVGVGPLTIIPLLFFSNAVKKLKFSIVGVWQYLAPIGQFLLGVLIFNEAFSTTKVVGCSLIILGAIVFLMNSVLQDKSEK